MNLTHPFQYDFLPRFYRLAIINILSNIVVPLAGLLSVAFLGHLTEIRHLAGVALASILFDYIYNGLGFLRLATTAMTAIAVGGDDREALLLVGLRNGLIALGLGILILSLHYPLQELGFALLSAAPEVKASGIAYFNVRIWGVPAVLLNFVLIGWFLGREMSGFVLLLTVVGTIVNITLDYLLIIHWDWASTGAGLSMAVRRYLMLLVGLILVSLQISWKEVRTVARKLWDLPAFQTTFTLNGNLFVRALATASTWAIFTNLSAAMGTTVLTENALLVEIVMLSTSIFQGIGFATASLGGNFKGQEANHQLLPLLQTAVGSSLLLGLTLAGMFSVFPGTVFGLFTNHAEVIEAIKIYVPWLFLVLGCAAITFSLEGYFAGLAQGHTIRNAALIGTFLGFAPLAVSAWYFHSNHILWLAVSAFMATRAVMLGVELPRTFKNNSLAVEHELAS